MDAGSETDAGGGGSPDSSTGTDASMTPDVGVGIDSGPPPESNCDDGVDDDEDGAIDCADSDCAADPACTEDCANGVDDDDDEEIDCADRDCAEDDACGELELCGDAMDNDSDGQSDCDDSECSCDAACGGPSCPGGTISNRDMLMLTTVGACHAFSGSCSRAASPEITRTFTAPADGQYYFTLGGFDERALMFMRRDDCGGAEIRCAEAPSTYGHAEILLTMTSGQTVVIFAETTSTVPGRVTLSASRVPGG